MPAPDPRITYLRAEPEAKTRSLRLVFPGELFTIVQDDAPIGPVFVSLGASPKSPGDIAFTLFTNNMASRTIQHSSGGTLVRPLVITDLSVEEVTP